MDSSNSPGQGGEGRKKKKSKPASSLGVALFFSFPFPSAHALHSEFLCWCRSRPYVQKRASCSKKRNPASSLADKAYAIGDGLGSIICGMRMLNIASRIDKGLDRSRPSWPPRLGRVPVDRILGWGPASPLGFSSR